MPPDLPHRRAIPLRISYTPEESTNQNPEGKNVRVDVECVDENGQRFVVEVQRSEQHDFYDRAVFNSTFAIQRQLHEGTGRYGFTLTDKPKGFDEEIFDLLFSSADLHNFAPEDKVKYENDMTTERDIQNQIDFAQEKGFLLGHNVGVTEGKQEEQERIVANLKAQGISEEIIAKAIRQD